MSIKSQALLPSQRNLKYFIMKNQQTYFSNSHCKNIKSLSQVTSFNDQSTRLKSDQINNSFKKDILCDFTYSQDSNELDTKSIFLRPKPIFKISTKHAITSLPKSNSIINQLHLQQQQKATLSIKSKQSNKLRSKKSRLILRIKDVIYNNKKKAIYQKDIENDKVNFEDLYTYHLKRKVRESLISDINFSVNTEYTQERDKFYSIIENKVNFIEDIFRFPHFMNTLWINHCANESDRGTTAQVSIINNKILHPNSFTKQFILSINKERQRLQFEKDDKNKINRMILQYLKEKHLINPIDDYCYDIERYFLKLCHYKNNGFASQKVKKAIFELYR